MVPTIARAWVVLMKRLGYTKFVAQGAIGARSSPNNGSACPPELLGIHVNMPGVFRTTLTTRLFPGRQRRRVSPADEKLAYERLQFVYQKGIGYGYQKWDCARRTLYGIVDSRSGLAAYFLDHDKRSYELIARVFDGKSEGLTATTSSTTSRSPG